MSILNIEVARGFRDLAIHSSSGRASGVHIAAGRDVNEFIIGNPQKAHIARFQRGVLLGSVAHLGAFTDLYESHTIRRVGVRSYHPDYLLVDGAHSWILCARSARAEYRIGVDGSAVVLGSVDTADDSPRSFKFEDLFDLHDIIISDES